MSIDVETLAGTVWRIAAQKQDGLGIWKIHRWKHPKSSEKAWLHHKFSGEKAVNGRKWSQRLADTHKWKNCWVSWETLRLYVQFVFRDCKSFAKKCEKAVDNCHMIWYYIWAGCENGWYTWTESLKTTNWTWKKLKKLLTSERECDNISELLLRQRDKQWTLIIK